MSKISKEELKKLQEQEQKKNALLHDIGLLHSQAHSLSHAFTDVVSEQEKDKKTLEKEYGKINIDLKDGSYTEIKEEEKDK
tara:strand:- start:298 stop:540 length:243 start_codon:yes stop_codon:yes gene_type:complete